LAALNSQFITSGFDVDLEKSPVCHPKEPYISTKEPYIQQKSPVFHQRSPTFHQKSPVLFFKRSLYFIKRQHTHIYMEYRAPLIQHFDEIQGSFEQHMLYQRSPIFHVDVCVFVFVSVYRYSILIGGTEFAVDHFRF